MYYQDYPLITDMDCEYTFLVNIKSICLKYDVTRSNPDSDISVRMDETNSIDFTGYWTS
jgi:hypothetical protein